MYQFDNELRILGESIMNDCPKFHKLIEADLRIAFLISDKQKKRNGTTVFADCQKINEKNKILSGYDFAITFYADSFDMTEEQRNILMQHELMHIGVDEDGKASIVPHDFSDFKAIIEQYGIDWADIR